MRNRRHVYYEVFYCGPRCFWWSAEVGWFDRDARRMEGNYSSCACPRTFRNAVRVAKGLRYKLGDDYRPEDIMIFRLFWKHGRLFAQEFTLR